MDPDLHSGGPLAGRGCVVLGLQFARRKTATSRIILGAAALTMGLCQLLSWHTG